MHVTRGIIISRTRGDRKSFFWGKAGGVFFFVFFVFIEDSRPSIIGNFCGEKKNKGVGVMQAACEKNATK